jgi:hypothetical protein
MASINFDANNNPIDGKSHVILRTNPLLTSNVKLVVDSNGEIYLDSINANRSLSDKRYKKYSLDRNGHYAYDIASFYANTPYDMVYDALRKDSDLSVYREYHTQYEEQYNYGARLNFGKHFNENIRFMAPLWIDQKLPGYFVIYRIEEPVSEVNLTDDLPGINNRIMKMLSNATLVKAFDMRKGSKIGDYLNTFANDSKRPIAPLTVSFEKDQKTSWNGIDLRKGGFASKGEYIYRDFVSEDRAETMNNEFITNGFKRNQMVSANLINMEFLFEDFDNAYEVNRYIGIYVNAHEEGSFEHLRYAKGVLTINPNTISTTFDLDGTSLSPSDMLPNTELSDPTLHWVKSINSFGHVKNIYAGQQDPYKLNVNAFNIDSSKYVKKSDTLTVTRFLQDAKDFIEITVNDNPNTSDEYIVGARTEIIQSSAPFNRFKIVADNALNASEASGHRFSTKGSTQDVAKAMKKAILNIEDLELDIKINGNKLVITNYKTGNRTYSLVFGTGKLNASNLTIRALSDDINMKLGLDPYIYSRFDTYTGIGGSARGNCILVDSTEVGDVDTNTYLKSGEKFLQVLEVVEDPDFENYYRVCLTGSIDTYKVTDINLPLYIINTIKFGKFEAFDFHDFDYNFYSSANSQMGELQYEIDYDIDGVDPNQLGTITGDYARLQGVKNPVTQTSTGKTFVNSEYDRLEENNNTALALTSRVIPTINKWKYFEGVNGKELPYMLSMSEAFGKTNFSPDIEVTGRSINDMTHEWYYLYKYPTYSGITTDADKAALARTLTSYIQPEVDINLQASDLMDVNNNYFDRLFTYEGYDILGTGFAPAGPSNKFVTLRGGSTKAPAEALFRGLKVKLYERKETQEANPRNLITSTKFNGYRFTAVLNYNNNQAENDINIKAIQNDKFKFVCLYIEMNTTDDSIESLNRELLYKLRDIFKLGTYADTEINGYINFDISQDADGKYADGIGVGTKLARDIALNNDGGYNRLEFQYAGLTWQLSIIEVTSNNNIRIATDNYQITDTLGTTTLNITGLSESDWANMTFTYKEGGRNLAKSLLTSISTKNIADLLNNNDTQNIEYITVAEDGTISNNKFIINVEDGNKVSKFSKLIPVADPNKPDSYKISAGKVGYIVVERLDVYNVELIRMSGHYTPLSRPVVTFTDLYPEYKTTQIIAPDEREKLIYDRYNRMGIAFGSYMNRGQHKYGLIEDLFYHKVNPEKADGILKLSNSTSSQPLYPLINEIAIDKRDINVFRSSWEDQYYVKNGSSQNHQNVYGTLSAYEESAFLASTLNLPKNQYEITKYDDIQLTSSLQQLTAISNANNYNGDILQFEDQDRIYMQVNVDNLLVDLLEADNAGISIKRFVQASQSYGDKTTLDDDIRKYVEVNLLKLMNIIDVKVYSRDDKSIKVSEVLSADSLNDILESGFIESKDFRIEYDNINPLKIRLIYNKRAGFRHKLYIYIKIRS